MAANSTAIVSALSDNIRTQINQLTASQKQALLQSIISDLTSSLSSEAATPSHLITTSGHHSSLQTSINVAPSPSTPDLSHSNMNGTIVVNNHPTVARVRTRRNRDANGRRKKPVNAFMVFRAFYSPLLTGLPQKVRSPFLGKMWRAEQRQNLFTLLGAAFSTIRDDVAEPGMTMDKFLLVACNAVGVIPVEEYLETAGWTIVDDDLVQIPVDDSDALEKYPLKTNVSSNDLVMYCFEQGLLTRNPFPGFGEEPASRTAQATMAFAVQPQTNAIAPAVPPSSITISSDNSLATTPISMDEWPLFDLEAFGDIQAQNDSGLSLNHVTEALQQTYDQTPGAAHWSPLAQPPVLDFDPDLIQSLTNPFSFETESLLNFDI